jgi:hypothetical protein
MHKHSPRDETSLLQITNTGIILLLNNISVTKFHSSSVNYATETSLSFIFMFNAQTNNYIFKLTCPANKYTLVKYVYHILFIVYVFQSLSWTSSRYLHKNIGKIQQTAIYLYNIAVCCILSVFLWRYPDDGRNSYWKMQVINNIR